MEKLKNRISCLDFFLGGKLLIWGSANFQSDCAHHWTFARWILFWLLSSAPTFSHTMSSHIAPNQISWLVWLVFMLCLKLQVNNLESCEKVGTPDVKCFP